jgi:beta-lactamase class A
MEWKQLLLNKKFSSLHLLLTAVITGFCFYIFNQQSNIEDVVSNNKKTSNTKINFTRDQHYKYTKPLIGFEMDKPSRTLLPIKESMQKVVSAYQEAGSLYDASIFLRDLETGEWTIVNEDEKYHPGSLIKVPMLMYYLKKAETDPTVLEKQLMLQSDPNQLPNQTYKAQQIVPGIKYSVRELLKYMVAYSDNNATFLLNNNCSIPDFKKVFSTHGIAEPNVFDTNYVMNVKEYSVFMRSLYNATFLSPQYSDYALSLLSESSFTQGMSNKIPKDVVVARKFGEAFRSNKRELHESGIIYCNKRPYILIVMTKGANQTNQVSFISAISETIFKSFCI